MKTLREGLVVEMVLAAGREVPGDRDKVSILCVLHEDTVPSAFIIRSKNIYGCSKCTGGRGWSAKKLCEALGLNWMAVLRGIYAPSTYVRPQRTERPKPTFTPDQARTVWAASKARARNDEFTIVDADVHGYAAARGLVEACEIGLYGIVGVGMDLPASIAHWPDVACRIVVPLYDSRGEIVSIQGRKIDGSVKKTLFPSGPLPTGVTFANEPGRCLRAGTLATSDPVVFGEGLTDFLALSIALPLPVISVPGTGSAVAAVDSWANGRTVILALDCDQAARNVLDDTSAALYRAGATRVLRVRWPKPCKDACDVIAAHGAVFLHDFITAQAAKVTA